MQTLTEIFRDKDVDTFGKTVHREAVRAVTFREKSLLMIYSPVNGDYKFPGGGVGKNESPEDALKREVREECGARLVRILQEIGCIVEYSFPIEHDYDVFKMTSSYYLCEFDSVLEEQRLDPYEEELGFQPVWVDIATAIQTNKAILQARDKKPPRWTAREAFMLEYLKEHCI